VPLYALGNPGLVESSDVPCPFVSLSDGLPSELPQEGDEILFLLGGEF
jgi:hypothetical protein